MVKHLKNMYGAFQPYPPFYDVRILWSSSAKKDSSKENEITNLWQFFQTSHGFSNLFYMRDFKMSSSKTVFYLTRYMD